MTEPDTLTRTLSLAVHEFRTPISVALGYLRFLIAEQNGPLTDKQRKFAAEANQACRRISALVDEMSAVGKLASQELALARQEIDLNGLLPEVASHMHEGADRGVILETRVADRAAMMTGDRARISAAFSALMRAALREQGQPATVVAQCSVVRESDRTWALVAIGEASILARLLEAPRGVATFDEFVGGNGLSLPLARRVIEAHGGTIWSAAGVASCASALRLPLRD